MASDEAARREALYYAVCEGLEHGLQLDRIFAGMAKRHPELVRVSPPRIVELAAAREAAVRAARAWSAAPETFDFGAFLAGGHGPALERALTLHIAELETNLAQARAALDALHAVPPATNNEVRHG